MSSQREVQLYRVVMVRIARDGSPRWGVQRPQGDFLTAMGRIEEYILKTVAEQVAAERNEAKGLVP